MFAVRVKKADSWLDPESAGILGWKLGKRLQARCEGQEGRFITLTYDPKRWTDAQECFDRARADKHVSRFMRKLAVLLGVDLKGQWLCKMEFQESGFVHWHILLLGVGFIDPEKFRQIYDLWGKGSIDIRPLTEGNIKYLTKYVAKGGAVPGWLYAYPSRSIKVVRTSEGFWNDEQAEKAREKVARSKAESEPKKESEEFYEPIGQKLQRQRSIFRIGEKCFSVEAPRDRVVALLRKFCGLPRVEAGWWFYDVPRCCMEAVVSCLRRAAEPNAPKPPVREDGSERAGEGRVPLFLIGTGNRAGWWKVKQYGVWSLISPEERKGKWRQWWQEHGPAWEWLQCRQEYEYAYGEEPCCA